MIKQRNIGVDILKFMAVVLVLNSHFDSIYPGPLDKLATGGTIADGLFFMCSGFTMLLGGGNSLLNYYKKRIYRIYPSVIAWGIVGIVLFNREDSVLSLTSGGWFVNCIMVYYLPIFLIRRFCPDKTKICLIVYTLFIAVVYFVHERPGNYDLLNDKSLKNLFFFITMLLGAYLGKYHQFTKGKMTDVAWLTVSFVSFFGFVFLRKYFVDIQLLSILSLVGVCYYGYKVCNIEKVITFCSKRYIYWVIRFVGGLCLEVYLINLTIIHGNSVSSFPLSLFIVLLEIIILAYGVRCLSRFLIQTFSKDEYRWKEVFQLII